MASQTANGECKSIEQRLRESEEYYRTLVDTSPDAIAIIDGAGHLQFASRRAYELFGIPDGESMNGTSISMWLAPDMRKTAIERFRMILAGETKPVPNEYTLRKKDGTVFWAEIHGSPLAPETEGGMPRLLLICRDVSEQKMLREQVFEAQKVQSLGTLAGGIAHDFNNILGIILGYVSMLEGRHNDPQRHAEIVAIIMKNVERGASLVQQILTFARKTDVSFTPLDMPELVREMIRMLEEMFPRTITFSQKIAAGLPVIMADRTQIHQALLNLCINARDAMPKGGTITFALDVCTNDEVRAHYRAASESAYLRIAVSDTGEGMDDETRRRVFDPFFTTKEQGKGPGLGLSVVYGIVQAHQGFIGVESRKGAGTDVTLLLPAAVRSAEQPTKRVKPAPGESMGGTEQILVVEDEEYLMKIVCTFLQSKGYRVLKATDGQMAVDVYAEHRGAIDAVLTDIGLPKMNGIDEFRKLKELDPDVIVILASGYFDPALKEELYRSGAKGFIQKPYRPNDLLKTIRTILDNENPHRSTAASP